MSLTVVSKADLRIGWATHTAAKYACENWHYSRCMPVPPIVKIGAWENSTYVGAVLFSRGANNNMLKPFGLSSVEGCELTRVALTSHHSPVTRIVKIAIKFLFFNSPGLRLIVSFADPQQGHHGGIYQAGNWIYSGQMTGSTDWLAPDGKIWHGRMVKAKGWTVCHGKKRKTWRPDQCKPVKREGKHRYLMPLDAEMRAKIAPLAKPYPKRDKQAMVGSPDTAAVQH